MEEEEEYLLEDTLHHAMSNSIEYITIATTGNGTDFGDISNPEQVIKQHLHHQLVEYWHLEVNLSPSYSNTIDYVTISSKRWWIRFW